MHEIRLTECIGKKPHVATGDNQNKVAVSQRMEEIWATKIY